MVALVTGGSRGIGLAIVEELIKMNYFCLVATRHCTEEITRLQQKGQALFIPCDIGIKEDRESLFCQIEGKYTLDLLVNCAGVAPRQRHDMLEMTEEEMDEVLNINQKGTFFISQKAAKLMKEAGHGRMVFISSVSSYTASVERAQYCISKSSISMYTKLFAARMAQYGVYVFEVSPGIIETDMTKVVKEKYEKLIAEGLTPIARMGTPQDVAQAVAVCASGSLDFCTGSVIAADGGFGVRRL